MLVKLFFLFNFILNACINSDNPSYSYECIEKINPDNPSYFEDKCSSLILKNDWYGYLCMCRIKRIQKKYQTAESFCKKSKELNPFSPFPYIELAVLYRDINKPEQALTEIEFAVKLKPDNFHSNYYAAVISEYTQNYFKAISYYRKLLEIKKGKDENTIKKIDELKRKISEELEIKKNKRYSLCVKKYRNTKDKIEALKIIENCFRIKGTIDQNLFEDYINLLFKNHKYREIIKLEKELTEHNSNSYIKILAESYYETGDVKKAVFYYSILYRNNKMDIKDMLKYAEILEEYGDKLTELEVYKKIYINRPERKIHDKIEELKLELMSDEEIIKELKERGFNETNFRELLNNPRKLFYKIKLLESKGAVDYLLKKYPGYANILMKDKNTGFYKLTLTGYEIYLKHISQKAIKEFEKRKVPPRYIFKLKDENSNPVFDKKGNLTYEGLLVYFNMNNSEKRNFYYPYENPKPEQARQLKDLKAEKIIEKLLKNGYEEITAAEYLYLINATNCPESVLLNPPCNIKRIKYLNDFKYFACSDLKCVEDSFYTPIKLFTYIVSYREGKPVKNEPSITSFFGSGASRKRFCENGKIWRGPEMSSEKYIQRELEKDLKRIREYRKKFQNFLENYQPKPGF